MTGANRTVDVTPQNQSMLEFRSNKVHDRGRPRPSHRPSANLVLAYGVTVRRLSQRRHHDPRGSIHAASVFGGCTDLLGIFRIENVDAVNKGCGFVVRNASTPGTGADRPTTGVTMVLRNNTVRPWPGRALETIQMSHTTAKGNSPARRQVQTSSCTTTRDRPATTSASTSIRKPHRTSTVASRCAAIRRCGRRSTGIRAR